MPSSKSADQLLLEEFIGAEFGIHPVWPALVAQVFDGAMPWSITFSEELRQLLFQGDARELNLGFPCMEIFVNYSKLEVGTLAGVGEVLKITPQPDDRDGIAVWFVKSPDGRISPASFSIAPF
ncbi:hypothetical protein EON83_15285 [bacterium]|nr:MAG: hypothetical protein EON83_15285 [bacterium]